MVMNIDKDFFEHDANPQSSGGGWREASRSRNFTREDDIDSNRLLRQSAMIGYYRNGMKIELIAAYTGYSTDRCIDMITNYLAEDPDRRGTFKLII